jgi:hypothetical protein
LNKTDAVKARIMSVTTSPIPAAIGVAKLSGLSLNFMDSMMIARSKKSNREKSRKSFAGFAIS